MRIGRIGRAGGCPAVSPGIVSPAGVQMRADECIPAPDDHLAASPNSRVSVLPDGRNDGAHRDNETFRCASSRKGDGVRGIGIGDWRRRSGDSHATKDVIERPLDVQQLICSDEQSFVRLAFKTQPPWRHGSVANEAPCLCSGNRRLESAV